MRAARAARRSLVSSLGVVYVLGGKVYERRRQTHVCKKTRFNITERKEAGKGLPSAGFARAGLAPSGRDHASVHPTPPDRAG